MSKPLTKEEFNAELNKIASSLKNAPELLRYIDRCHPNGEYRTRLPIGLIGTPQQDGYVDIKIQPYVACRPSHLVVSEETAKNFDLIDITIGNVMGKVSSDDVPMEPFSVKYYASEESPRFLFDVQEWDLPTVSPTSKIRVLARTKNLKASFRGILWANAQLL